MMNSHCRLLGDFLLKPSRQSSLKYVNFHLPAGQEQIIENDYRKKKVKLRKIVSIEEQGSERFQETITRKRFTITNFKSTDMIISNKLKLESP